MRYENQEFADQRLPLDGNQYVGCRIERCVLVFEGTAPFELQRNSFNTTRIELAGAAAFTISVLISLRTSGFAASIDQLLEGIKESPPPGTPTN